MTYFVLKQIDIPLQVVKYCSFALKFYSLFASQDSLKIVASKTLPARIDTLQGAIHL